MVFNKKRADDRKEWLGQYDRKSYLDTTAEDVTFSDRANILGDVNANKVTIEGKVKGAVTSKQLSIKQSADVEGDLITESLSIEDGAKLKIKDLKKKEF